MNNNHLKNYVHKNFSLIENGNFLIGNNSEDSNFKNYPIHKVNINYNFYIKKIPVTFKEYYFFCEKNNLIKPFLENDNSLDCPVVNVTWWDAIEYCDWLNNQYDLPPSYDDKGHFIDINGNSTEDPSDVVGFRLPTEAEWEYSAKGGNYDSGYHFSGSDNINEVGWFIDNSNKSLQKTAQKKSNAKDLYDMSGNVWEWCSDILSDYTETEKINPYINSGSINRIVRGGSWYSFESSCKVYSRGFGIPSNKDNTVGFRIVINKEHLTHIPIKNNNSKKTQMKLNSELDIFLEICLDLVAVLDKEGNFLKLNNEWKNLLNYSLDDLKKMNFLDLIHEDYLHESRVFLKNILNKEKFKYMFNKIKSNHNNYRKIEWKFLSKDDNIYISGRDLTERIDFELAHRNSEEKFKLLFQNTPLGLVIYNNKGEIKSFNNNFVNIINITPKEILKLNFNNIPNESIKSKFLDSLKGYNSVYDGLYVSYNKKRELYVRIFFSPIINKSDYFEGGIAIIEDITEKVKSKKRLELFSEELESKNDQLTAANQQLEATYQELEASYQTLEETNEDLRLANEIKSNFLSRVSHELRTPLIGIINGSELALNSKKLEDIKELLEIIKDSGYKLIPIIENILNLSKIEKNNLVLYETKINLNSFLVSILYPLKKHAQNKNLLFEIINNIEDNIYVYADSSKLNQIIKNIIENSIKFTEKGSISVIINSTKLNDILVLKFKIVDTGIGIKKENIEKIFEPFEQTEDYMTRKYGGAGLGLTVSREIIKLMNGTISFEANQDKGTTFFFQVRLRLTKSL